MTVFQNLDFKINSYFYSLLILILVPSNFYLQLNYLRIIIKRYLCKVLMVCFKSVKFCIKVLSEFVRESSGENFKIVNRLYKHHLLAKI